MSDEDLNLGDYFDDFDRIIKGKYTTLYSIWLNEKLGRWYFLDPTGIKHHSSFIQSGLEWDSIKEEIIARFITVFKERSYAIKEFRRLEYFLKYKIRDGFQNHHKK